MQRHQTFSEIGLFFPCWYLVIAVTSYNEHDNVDESVMSLNQGRKLRHNRPLPISPGLCIKTRLSAQPLIHANKTQFHKKGCALESFCDSEVTLSDYPRRAPGMNWSES